MIMKDVLGLILGGGRGTRLYPLTHKRSKPAVPLAGKYRLIDIPISNCLNSGINKISILTQYNSVSLHRHIANTYRRDMFTDSWVEILAAEQTPNSEGWYQGTADAVRQQLTEIVHARTKYVLILAGDHLYQMDYRKFVNYHVDTKADITIAIQPVSADLAPALGILKRNPDGEIVDFKEKPDPSVLDGLQSMPGEDKPFMASMGIYVFSTELLVKLLDSKTDDFGKDIIPGAIKDYRVMGHIFNGYWADIGTIKRFYEVNLELASLDHPLELSNRNRIVYTHPRFLPPCEIFNTKLDRALITDGCRILGAEITNSIVGLRCLIGSDVIIKSSILMGSDYYETPEEKEK